MRQPSDVVRSIARYMSSSLGSEWEVRWDDEQGSEHWPFCRVRRAGPVAYSGRTTFADVTMAVNLVCYAGPQATTELAGDAAFTIENLLASVVLDGRVPGRFLRIPLYAYDGVGLDEPATDDDNRQNPSDFIRVSSFTTEPIAEPDDARRVAVVGSMRVTWRRPGVQADLEGPLTQQVIVSSDPDSEAPSFGWTTPPPP